jgi:E3 ubiquitin-protein ligase RNF115/126
MREGSGPGGEIPQEFMMNQILGMLARRYTDRSGSGAGGPNPFADLLGMHQGGSEAGRLGDYVLNQQGKHRSLTKQEAKQIPRVALDQIMTALMENSNAHRPVPATEQTIGRLDHEVLEEGCAWSACPSDLALLTLIPSPPS